MFFALYFTSFSEVNAEELNIKNGYYVGTGTSLPISGIGFEPEIVLVKSDTNAGVVALKTSAMPSPNLAFFTNAADNTTSQLTLDDDGFTLGTLAGVNTANVRFTYTAMSGSDCTATGEVCVGFYIGDGTASRKITTGFQPDLIWVKRSSASANWHSSAMPATTGQFFDVTNEETTGLLYSSIDPDGFYVGSTNNTNLLVYYYIAFKNTSDKVSVGTYTGNATDNTDITGVGFDPDLVVVKKANGGAALSGVFNSNQTYGDYSSLFTNTANTVNNIQALITDGFQIGDSNNVNLSASDFYWSAFKETESIDADGEFEIMNGSYVGTGAGFSITDLNFDPDLVIIKHDDQATDQHAVFRTRTMAGDSTAYLSNAVANFASGITSFDTEGFTVGTNATVNTSGDTYYWTAFGNAWRPDTNTGSEDFIIGAFTGNGLDDRDITEQPHESDMVVVKRFGASVGAWKPSNVSGDFSLFFSATAGIANVIQAINSDGFEVGTDASVNTSGGLYHWFSFKESSRFDVGNYIGNGTSQSITSPGFEPGNIWIKPASVATRGITRSSVQTGDSASPFTNASTITGGVTAILPTGFTVGNSAESNSNSVVYNYASWIAPDLSIPTADITYSDADSIVKAGDGLTITATFSEPLADTPVVQITGIGANAFGPVNMNKVNSTTYTYVHTVTGGDGTATTSLSVGEDLTGNEVEAVPTSGETFEVDNTPPATQDTVFPLSLSVDEGDTVTIISSGTTTNSIWFAPAGTTSFNEDENMTKAGNGLSTSINAPEEAGEYVLYVLDAAGNVSTASVAVLTVNATASSGGGGGGSKKNKNVVTAIPAVVTNATSSNTSVYIPSSANIDQSTNLFPEILSVGDEGARVTLLQIFLTLQGSDIYPDKLITGYYGSLTAAAVTRFQEKYAEEILSPSNYTSGTGMVGPSTANKITNLIFDLIK